MVIIPVRSGNGAMERLQAAGLAGRPSIGSLYRLLASSLRLAAGRGRVFADLWDAERLENGDPSFIRAAARIRRLNETQDPLFPEGETAVP